MEESVFTSVVLPASLVVIMVGLGLSLHADDFRRVVKEPRAVSIGLLNQLLLLPLLALGVALLLDLPPLLAVGLMLLAAAPGGATSNLIAHAARGDTALSVTLTAVSSMVTVVTLPLIVTASIAYFIGESRAIDLPLAETIGQVLIITVIPVAVGMLVRGRAPAFAARMERPVRIASVVLFALVLAGIILGNLGLIRDNFGTLGGAVLLLNVATMALGWGLSRLARLNLERSITIMVESGIQNGTLAIVVATTLLRQGDVALPAGMYSLVMFLTGGLVIGVFGSRLRPGGGAEAIASDRSPAIT